MLPRVSTTMRTTGFFHFFASLMAWPLAAFASPPSSEIRMETFRVVWETVRDTYYDAGFNGVDWDAAYASRKPAVAAADDMETLRAILRGMLAEIGQSHFAIISESTEMLKPGEARGSGTLGIEVVVEDDLALITRVDPESPAVRAGIRTGMKLVRIGERDLGTLAADAARLPVPENLKTFTFNRYIQDLLTGPIRREISLYLVGQPGATSREFRMKFAPDPRKMSGTFGNMPPIPIEFEHRRIEETYSYLRFNVFILELMDEIRAVLTGAAERRAAGLIIDLRGNPGGIGYMAAGIAGLLADQEISLGTMQMREGHFSFIGYPQPQAYTGPVALLVDGRSASTSEILAAGLQEAGRVRVFGASTAGAVLPSMFKDLPNGDTLQCVVADFKTAAGVFLEGRGVVPDEPVRLSRPALLAGKDPILQAAVQWLDTQPLQP